MHLDEINKLFNKNPSILRLVTKYHEDVPDYKILHASFIIKDNKQKLNNLKLVYSQYKSFDDVYNALLSIEDKTKDYFSYYSKKELIDKLTYSNIPYIDCDEDILIVEIDSHKKMKEYGSHQWCIYQDKKFFKTYTKNGKNKQYILFNFRQKNNSQFKIGFTVEVKKKGMMVSAISDNENEYFNLNYKAVNELIPKNNTLNLFNIHPKPVKTTRSEQFALSVMVCAIFTLVLLVGSATLYIIDIKTLISFSKKSISINHALVEINDHNKDKNIKLISKGESILMIANTKDTKWKIDIKNKLILTQGFSEDICLTERNHFIKRINMKIDYPNASISDIFALITKDKEYGEGCVVVTDNISSGNFFYKKITI
jgi:hypothetical protein